MAPAPQPVQMMPAPVYESPRPQGGGFLRRLFGRSQPAQPEYYMEYAPPPAPTPMPVPGASPFNGNRPLPAGMPGQAPVIIDSTEAAEFQGGQPEPRVNLKVVAKNQDKVGHEDDYSWVTGQLFYVHTDGGRWVVRYGLPDQVDKYGGSIVLAPTVEMKNFREGDLVCVTGRVVDEGRVSRSLGGALYRAETITIVDRSDP
jgi:hypothetical protein